jgi:hypothetical protein
MVEMSRFTILEYSLPLKKSIYISDREEHFKTREIHQLIGQAPFFLPPSRVALASQNSSGLFAILN